MLPVHHSTARRVGSFLGRLVLLAAATAFFLFPKEYWALGPGGLLAAGSWCLLGRFAVYTLASLLIVPAIVFPCLRLPRNWRWRKHGDNSSQGERWPAMVVAMLMIVGLVIFDKLDSALRVQAHMDPEWRMISAGFIAARLLMFAVVLVAFLIDWRRRPRSFFWPPY